MNKREILEEIDRTLCRLNDRFMKLKEQEDRLAWEIHDLQNDLDSLKYNKQALREQREQLVEQMHELIREIEEEECL
jgi:chromosome segregation ATPase